MLSDLDALSCTRCLPKDTPLLSVTRCHILCACIVVAHAPFLPRHRRRRRAVDGSTDERKLANAVSQLREFAESVRVLGSYRKAEDKKLMASVHVEIMRPFSDAQWCTWRRVWRARMVLCGSCRGLALGAFRTGSALDMLLWTGRKSIREGLGSDEHGRRMSAVW